MKEVVFGALVALVIVTGCSEQDSNTPSDRPLIVYSGRSKTIVEPLLAKFTEATGIAVEARFGSTAQLGVALLEEGAASPADVFWSQDAGALGAVSAAGMLRPLTEDERSGVPESYQSSDHTWVATSGRARTLAYAPSRVERRELPASVLDLEDPKWAGRIGWAPTNGSFQSFVTAMRHILGEDRTRDWLVAVKANEAKSYPKNSAIIQAIAAGEVDLGLPNHYYLLQFKRDDPDFPVEQTAFEAGDPGNLVNIAGVGVLATSTHPGAGALVMFLLSDEAQDYVAAEILEYPVAGSGGMGAQLADSLGHLSPTIDLNDLKDLEGTLTLLRSVELL